MAATLSARDVRQVLVDIRELLQSVGGEENLVQVMQNFIDRLDHADDADLRGILGEILAMFHGGMGGFQDVVLQDRNGVKPEQDQFDELRGRLFEAARVAI